MSKFFLMLVVQEIVSENPVFFRKYMCIIIFGSSDRILREQGLALRISDIGNEIQIGFRFF